VTTIPIDGKAMFEQAEGNRQAHLSDANDANIRTHMLFSSLINNTRDRDKP
jgi:hypothetical protein